jgi:tetratricopeptide (TPR) repeat protein
MSGIRGVAGLAVMAAFGLMLGNAVSAMPQATGGAQDNSAQNAPKYTMPEYNAEQACAQEQNPATQITCLNDFVSKYPNSALLVYVYPMYLKAYGATKNYAKVIEYADKVVALGDKVDAATRFNAYYAHAMAYTTMLSADKTAQTNTALAKSAQDSIAPALKTLDDVKKPDGVADDAWTKQLTQFKVALNSVGAQAALVQKDYPGAINFYKAVLAIDPAEPSTNYNLGRAYLQLTPPQTIDAMWYVARAVSSKNATQQQVTQLTPYLNKLIQNYQGGTVCDTITASEQKELLQLAASSADRPSSYTLPSSADLDAARKDMTIASVVADLKAGGDKSKLTWMASCGLEFPGVPGKVIEVAPGATDADPIDFKIAFVTSDAEFDAATIPNMEVKVAGQPEAKRVEKDGAVHFTATLVSYDPDPSFMLHWEKGKIADEDIPKEKEAPKKKTTKRKPPGR